MNKLSDCIGVLTRSGGAERTPARRFAPRRIALAVGAALYCLAGSSHAMPLGAEVVHGQAAISRPDANTLLVVQDSHRAVVNWNSFDLGGNELAQFRQPSASSSILNYITGQSPSTIAGAIQSNGQVIFVNPHGVHFTPTARVDVGGLVASTLNLALHDFVAGRLSFESFGGVSGGSVRNEGSISVAPGGVIALIGNHVENHGRLTAPSGSIGLAAGGRVKLDFDGDGLVTFQVDVASAAAKIVHTGTAVADGGRAALMVKASDALRSTVLNSSGIIQARGLGVRNGQIILGSGAEGAVAVVGSLDAVNSAADGKGGNVLIVGRDVVVAETARIDASGAAGGGIVLLGGGYQGRTAGIPGIDNAQNVSISPGAIIRADAIQSGNGGQVIVWGGNDVSFQGLISARGGLAGGDGGFVETSGKGRIDFPGNVDVAAGPGGVGGEWLIDPNDVRSVCPTPPQGCVTFDQIQAALNGGNNNLGGITVDQSSQTAQTVVVASDQGSDLTIHVPSEYAFNVTNRNLRFSSSVELAVVAADTSARLLFQTSNGATSSVSFKVLGDVGGGETSRCRRMWF